MRIRDLERLGVRLLTGDAEREFSAVYVTDLPDPGRYLSGGELVLSGLMWWHGEEDSAAFVAALVRSRVAALGAGQAWLGRIPEDLVRACEAAGLPLIEIPAEVSFREIVDVTVGRLAGDVREALGRHRRIVAAVAEGADLPELFALTAAELGVTGAVVSATGELIVGTAEDPVRLARAYLTAPRLPYLVEGRTVFGVGRMPRAAGWALVVDGDLTERADVGYELAACVALERRRLDEGRRVERRLLAELLAARTDLGPRLQTCGIGPGDPYAVVSAGTEPEILEQLVGRTAVAAPFAGAAVCLVAHPGDLSVRLRRGVEVLGDPALALGLSGTLTGADALRGGLEEAGHARHLAESRSGGVVTSAEIYTHALLIATAPADVRASFTRRLLGPLLDYDRRHQSELLRTLEVFLDCAGSWHLCGERMHVHVNTVRYRIRRVEELTGRDLSAMADRVDFYLALRAR
ncbi:PucR family transcriptional regulator [Nonomuraea sp. NPDC050328]|uniref:PucR family transcriptional regulator n=1 Tax=Nonomuraea sp. NPDC050328 TaxID=3364361 RepID=UPI0037B89AAC